MIFYKGRNLFFKSRISSIFCLLLTESKSFIKLFEREVCNRAKVFACFSLFAFARNIYGCRVELKCIVDCGCKFFAMAENPPQQLENIVEKLSWPESRDVLARVARECPQHTARTYALEKLPWPEERETIEAVVRTWGDPLAQLIMAKGGICPNCGAPVIAGTETVYMNDDPNDVSKECAAYSCEACRWEMIDDRTVV